MNNTDIVAGINMSLFCLNFPCGLQGQFNDVVVLSAILEVILPSCMLSVTSKRAPFVVQSTRIEEGMNSMGFFLFWRTRSIYFKAKLCGAMVTPE